MCRRRRLAFLVYLPPELVASFAVIEKISKVQQWKKLPKSTNGRIPRPSIFFFNSISYYFIFSSFFFSVYKYVPSCSSMCGPWPSWALRCRWVLSTFTFFFLHCTCICSTCTSSHVPLYVKVQSCSSIWDTLHKGAWQYRHVLSCTCMC
jgi:hypothetical protein